MTRTFSCLFFAASMAAFPLCAQTVLLSETFDDGVPSYEAWQFFAQACSEPMSVGEVVSSGDRTVVRVTDLLGRDIQPEPGVLMLIQYSDGTVEKRLSAE